MRAEIFPSKASGEITAPPSKSAAHRAIICACLADGESKISNIEYSQDILATVDCMRALGAEINANDDSLTVKGPVSKRKCAVLGCRESGSTLRFILPLASLICEECLFALSGRLADRPLGVYEKLFAENGISIERNADGLKIRGSLKPGIFTVDGGVSSQFISGLLFALPLLGGGSEIKIIPPIESRPYIDMTLSALKRFGVAGQFSDKNIIGVKGDSRYRPCDISIEGDWSNAAFFEALNFSGGSVKINGLDPESAQGDRICTELFRKLKGENSEIDLSDCPDLGPVMMACAYLNGAVFTGVSRLRLKESDRCGAMALELSKFGIKTQQTENTFTVYKSRLQKPAQPLDSHNDHRIVMAMSVLCAQTGGVIEGVQAVGKSFPSFFDKLKSTGIKVILNETS